MIQALFGSESIEIGIVGSGNGNALPRSGSRTVRGLFSPRPETGRDNGVAKNALMDGRVVPVTGSTDGIGKATALPLARKGATVLLHGRNRQKACRAGGYATHNRERWFASAISGRYFEECRAVSSSPISYDQKLQERLWRISRELAGLVM